MNVNFTSTYRIPLTQAGVNNAKKEKLSNLASRYENSLVSNQKTGTVRVSIANDEDDRFEKEFKSIGYKVYQKFEGENISKENLDEYIKDSLKYGEFRQKGKQQPPKKNFKTRPLED